MRIVVVGGAGFVGSHLVDRLLAEGHAVDVIDDLSTGSLANLAEQARARPRWRAAAGAAAQVPQRGRAGARARRAARAGRRPDVVGPPRPAERRRPAALLGEASAAPPTSSMPSPAAGAAKVVVALDGARPVRRTCRDELPVKEGRARAAAVAGGRRPAGRGRSARHLP